MNARIKELAEQARHDARDEKYYLERVHNREFTVDEFQEIYDKKFAELIVKECVQVIQDQSYYTSDAKVAGLDIAKEAIQKHFGGKE